MNSTSVESRRFFLAASRSAAAYIISLGRRSANSPIKGGVRLFARTPLIREWGNSRVNAEDEKWAKILRSGSQEGFRKFWNAFYRWLVWLVRPRVGKNDAENVALEVLVSAWRNGSRYDPSRITIRGWLRTIARARSIDCLRRERKRRKGREELITQAEPSKHWKGHDAFFTDIADATYHDEENTAMDNDPLVRFRKAVKQLPKSQRRVITILIKNAHRHDCYSTPDHCSMEQVRSRCSRSRSQSLYNRLRVSYSRLRL
ncbi:MAG: hypothetical protein HY372_02425 [Candidatus Andersenbacteria bacterium]|nr:hypothetical protein [Candidatus Andersenbacteria bacterium]